MYNFICQRLFMIKLFLYASSSALYLIFMDAHAPLGLAWRPFHQQRVFNAINHMLNSSPLLQYGLTSWDSINMLSTFDQPTDIYLVSALPYWFHSLLFSITSADIAVHISQFSDYILICFVAALSAEIFSRSFPSSSLSLSIFWPYCVFLLFLVSPWSYRMMLAPWHDVTWLFLILLASYFCLEGRRSVSMIIIFFAGLFHWQWSFFLSVLFAAVWIARHYSSRPMLQNLLPPCFKSKDANLQLVAILFIPFVLCHVQSILLHFSLPNVSHSGSSILFRIGIDNVQNIHHGGWLAAFQFLGGNRFSVCLPKNHTSLSSSIGLFNCIVSISGWIILSFIGLLGYLRICWSRIDMRWLFVPLLWVFFAFLLVFQQSYAVHLQGYSFIFSFVFAIGMAYLLSRLSSALKLSSSATILISLPLVSAILISAVRVSYFTDVYG
jgi:hypothetical protein